MTPDRTRRAWFAVAGLTLALVAWLGFRIVEIRSDLNQARVLIGGLSAPSELPGPSGLPDAGGSATGARSALAQKIDRVLHKVDAARGAARDPVWRAVSAVPVLGRSFRLVTDLTLISSELLHRTLPAALSVEDQLLSAHLVSGGRVNLAELGRLEQPLAEALQVASAGRARAARLSTRWVAGYVADGKASFLGQADRAIEKLNAARRTLDLTERLLGRDGPRRYFVAVMNEAESRAAGGLVGAYAVLRLDHGQISREVVGTDSDFINAPRPVVDLGAEFSRNYDRYYTRTTWSAVGASPHWPNTAKIIAGLWAAQGGGPLDGVIGMDPVSLSGVLDATGPVTVAGKSLSADTVGPFVFRDEYTDFGSHDVARKQVLANLAGAIFQRLVDGHASPTRLVRTLLSAIRTGHLDLYSAHPDEQQQLHGLAIAGELPDRAGAFVQAVTQNASSNKLDTYLHRSVTYYRPRRGLGRLVLTINNGVPDHAPDVVVQRLDEPTVVHPYGETRLLLTVYAGVGQHVTSVNVDHVPEPFSPGTERGHGTATLLITVPRGRTTVTAQMTDPGGSVSYREQPLDSPDVVPFPFPDH